MSKKSVLQVALCVIFILSLALPSVPGRAAELQSLPPTIDSHKSVAAPVTTVQMQEVVNWCVAGDMNGWNNASTPLFDNGTNGDALAGDGVYSLSMPITTAPATYEWKAVECGNWGWTLPAANSWFTTDSVGQVVTFLLDTNDYSGNGGMSLLPAEYIVNVTGDTLPTSYTAVGDFQGWDNANPSTLMTDMGNGYYRLVYIIPAAGSYIGRVVPTGSWSGFGADGRSVNGVNISFTTTADNQEVVFLLDSYTGRFLIEPVSSGAGTWCAAGGFNGWVHTPLYDDGTNGDLVGGDGVFMADATVSSAGRYEWKVTNCSWVITYPSANSWLTTTETDQVVKLSFDTNDHSTDAGLDMVPVMNIVHAWDSNNSFTAVGDWEGWNNANPVTVLAEIGYELYRLDAPVATSGAHDFKVVVTSSWDAIGNDNRSINADNIPFTTYSSGDVVPFLLDYRTGRVGIFPPPAPPQASHDNEVWWGQLGHNSRDTLYRNPGGPVTTDVPVTLRLRAAQGDLTEAKVRLYNDRTNAQTMLPMSIAHSDGTYDWWQVTVPASTVPTVYWYRFVAIDGIDTDYYEDDIARTMGWGQAFDESPDYSYQLTVYAPDFQTPNWIKNAVVYQVFPDRFRDGDHANDKPAGTFFYNEPGGTVYRSLTEDWNEPICDPRAAGDCAGTYSKNFYGGDLLGLIDKLDYLQDLGVTAIYLNPIFESPSNHGYDTTDYMTINPMFGDAALFNDLTEEIHTRGMHLILDGVFNHVSSDSIYFDRYGRYEEVGACESETSPYRSWFYFTDVAAGSGTCVGSTGTPGGATYESWWGYDSLPKLNSTKPQVRALIWDNEANPTDTVAGHYMQNADGWRLDVGADVDPGTINDPTNNYWEGFRNTVKAVNPDGYITGEEWGIANSWLLGGEWDAVMNYQFSSAVLSLWRDEVFTDNDHNEGSSAGALSPLSPEDFDERMQNLFERYNPEALRAMLNLFGSHDTSRAVFMLDHNTDLNNPALYANPDYDWSDAIARLKGAVAVQMTMPGAPTIYYGDEVGLVGPMAYSGGKWEDDPYNRQPYPWLDEGGSPFYTHLQTQAAQDDIYNYYATLTAARNAHPALRTGDFRTLLMDNELMLYAYGRNLPGEDSAVVLINRGTVNQVATLDVAGYLPNGAYYSDLLSSAIYMLTNGQLQNVAVSANSGLVLVLMDDAQMDPPEPVVLSAVANGTSVNLSWTPSAGIYLIYRTNLYGGGYELIGTVGGTTSFIDTGAVLGQRAYYVVVVENTTTGLHSEYSNEASAIPAYTIGWANLEFPPTITKPLDTTPTVLIYGQVWIDGVTSAPGATPGLWAQVGYGPNGSDPRENSAWVWSDAVFNADNGNNDEFKGTLLPEAVGEYDYVYRYSTDGANSWYYADTAGPVGITYDPANAGQMTITDPLESVPPTAPVLSLADWGASFIDLKWTASTDDVAVYAYDIYRSTDNVSFEMISRVLDPEITYHDDSVVTNQIYYYYVIALDTSFNPSAASNTVSHAAEPKMVSVTFDITVPAFTPPTVYLTRYINPDGTVGDWDPAATALSKSSDTLWTGNFNILDGTVMEFKFTRGTWETVMKGANGNEELANLSLIVDYGLDGSQTYTYTVLNWRDPIVVSTSPVNGATSVALGSAVVVIWSQAMAVDACPDVWVEPNPTDLVAVTCSFDADTNEMTIAPTGSFPPGAEITVGLSGLVDFGGDVQQVDAPLTFTTEYLKFFLPLVMK